MNHSIPIFATATLLLSAVLQAREWKFTGVTTRFDAEFVGMNNGWVVLQDTKGKSFEFAFDKFSPADQQFLRAITRPAADTGSGKPLGWPIGTGTVVENGDLAGSLGHSHPLAIQHRQAGGVIATVFEPPQAVDQHSGGIRFSDISYDSAHG